MSPGDGRRTGERKRKGRPQTDHGKAIHPGEARLGLGTLHALCLLKTDIVELSMVLLRLYQINGLLC